MRCWVEEQTRPHSLTHSQNQRQHDWFQCNIQCKLQCRIRSGSISYYAADFTAQIICWCLKWQKSTSNIHMATRLQRHKVAFAQFNTCKLWKSNHIFLMQSMCHCEYHSLDSLSALLLGVRKQKKMNRRARQCLEALCEEQWSRLNYPQCDVFSTWASCFFDSYTAVLNPFQGDLYVVSFSEVMQIHSHFLLRCTSKQMWQNDRIQGKMTTLL